MEYIYEKYSMENVLEKYIGRKPELIKIEKELEVIVDRINREVGSLTNFQGETTAHDINRSDENSRIEKLFKKLFGLKEFVLNWIWNPIPDAHTMVNTFQILDKNFGKRKDGSDFNANLFVGVQVSTGMVTLFKMDAGEILAIILHEIGHSFNKTIGQVLASVPPIYFTIANANKLELLDGSGRLISSLLHDGFSTKTYYTKFRGIMEELKDKFKGVTKTINAINELMLYIISIVPSTVLGAGNVVGLLNPFKTIFLYGVEKHSDGFAVDYGYGKEMASALNKLDRSHNHPKMDIPVLNWMYAFDDVIHEMILEPLTGYPNLHNRQRSALDRLRKASKDPDLDPRVRKELNEQLERFEGYYKDYMDIQSNENKKYFFTWMYRQFVDKFFNGKMDVRELVYAFEKDNPKNHGYYKEYLKVGKK